MATSLPLVVTPSVTRSPWLYYSLLAVLLLFILHNISLPRTIILQPGDLQGNSREVNPSDDQVPFPHEPSGPGTLRDVRENKFYLGGLSTLTSSDGFSYPQSAIYDPYPDYNGEQFQACQGPRGKPLDRSSPEDMVHVYPGIQKGFPPPMIGSYAAMGLDGYTCADRYSRLGLYKYGDNDQPTTGIEQFETIDWNAINWKSLESQCFERNAGRYKPSKHDPHRVEHTLPPSPPPSTRDQEDVFSSTLQYKSRSAIVLRAWNSLEWTDNLKHYVRSLIMELSLHSGAEYEVFVLCHVKDRDIPIDLRSDAMRHLKAQLVPAEFSDMIVLFNDKMLESWYPMIEEHSVIKQYWQPVQIFSQLFPDYDYYWQLEMDSRFTGHTYHFLEQATKFAKEQPRKYLWERNSYFYIPGMHGSWKDFIQMVDTSMVGRQSVWGPMPSSQITPKGPKPPSNPESDTYEWGVGEEADLITFLPIFDPIDTQWPFTNTLWNISEQSPRRTSPVVMGRISNTLLNTMHKASTNGIGLASEMTAPTFALWHGLKAVHVPHPIYIDGKWTPKELGRILNPGSPEKINGGSDSIWNWNHKWDHILYRMSYLFTSQTAEDLYRRWLGYVADPGQYSDGSIHQDPQGRNWFESGDLREDLYGRLCFPSMFLHPVKNTAAKKGEAMAVPV